MRLNKLLTKKLSIKTQNSSQAKIAKNSYIKIKIIFYKQNKNKNYVYSNIKTKISSYETKTKIYWTALACK